MSKLEIGVLVSLSADPVEQIEKVVGVGLRSCQVASWQSDIWTDETGERLVELTTKHGVQVSTFWAGYSGPAVWNFIQGPATIGLVPPDRRAERVATLKKGADFALRVSVPSITTHVGFIPESPNNPLYAGMLDALREVVEYCAERDITFCFETGQETPVTLLRVIEDLGSENLGINLDPANLLMYGKANPVDALDVFGTYVVGVHAKDGEYPTDGRQLGVEKPLGEGRVNFPVLVPKLKALGYDGALTIEREISGPRQIEDIKRAIAILSELL